MKMQFELSLEEVKTILSNWATEKLGRQLSVDSVDFNQFRERKDYCRIITNEVPATESPPPPFNREETAVESGHPTGVSSDSPPEPI